MALTSQQKKIVYLIISVLIFIVILSLFKKRPPKYVTLEMWGFYDEPEVWDQIISDFRKQYPNINIKYTQKDTLSYEDDLLNAFAENQAPDIFMVLGEWLPRYQSKIKPLDLSKEKELNLKYLYDNYPEITAKELVNNNQLLGIPLSIDTLALYYNKDIFNHFNIALPPKTWEEIIDLIPTLRQVDLSSNIKRSAIALGTPNNISWFSDILLALMMQYESDIVDLTRAVFTFNISSKNIVPGIKALEFYTQFADLKNKNYTWNENKINSLLAFSKGNVAMVLGYERAYNYIKSKNPQLNFGIAPFPQFKNSPLKVNYASTINLVVNNRSNIFNQQAAWTFLKYLTQTQPSENYFFLTGHPPARRDLVLKYLNDPVRGAFIGQILSSRSFYQFDNNQIKNILEEMITQVNRKKMNFKTAVDTAVQRLNYLWRQKLGKD